MQLADLKRQLSENQYLVKLLAQPEARPERAV